MAKIEKVEPYRAQVSQEIISRWNGVVRVWSEPKSAVEGSEVVDQIREPTEVTVVEEQREMFSSQPQRARVQYGECREGWVLYDALALAKRASIAGTKRKSAGRGRGKGVGRRTGAN
jgi:hypothetical protein